MQKQEKNLHTYMFANADQFHYLHTLPTSIVWIFIRVTPKKLIYATLLHRVGLQYKIIVLYITTDKNPED